MKELIAIAKDYNEGLIDPAECRRLMIDVISANDFNGKEVTELCEMLIDNE